MIKIWGLPFDSTGMRALKIAHVTVNFPPQIGGIGEVCATEAAGLALRGHQVTVFTLRQNQQNVPSIPPVGVRTVFLRPLMRGGDAGFLPQLLWHLKGFDVIHLHYPFYGAAEWVALASKLYGIPYVVTYHMEAQPPQSWKQFIKKFYDWLWAPVILQSAGRVITVDAQLQQGVPVFKNVAVPRLVEVPNAIDVESFSPANSQSVITELEGWENKRILLFVGNLLRLKRLDILVKALGYLPEDVVVVVVGGGYERARYEELVKNEGVQERVRFVGPCFDRTKLASYYARATAVVIPSEYESFSLVAIEAQATGAIVVASKIPALVSKITPGVDGFLFTVGSVHDLVQELSKVLALSPADRRWIGMAARERVVRRYSMEPHLNSLEKIYQSLVI